MADRLLRVNSDVQVMASGVIAVHRNSSGSTTVETTTGKYWLEPGYGEAEYQARERFISAVNAALADGD